MVKGVNGLIFTDCVVHENIWLRSAGAYRMATELRNMGMTIQVIDYWTFLTLENTGAVQALIDKFVGSETMFVGFSTSFINNYYGEQHGRKPHETVYNVSKKGMRHIRNRIKKINGKTDIIIAGAGAPYDNTGIGDVFVFGYGESHMKDYVLWKRGGEFKGKITSTHKVLLDYNTKNVGFDFNNCQIRWEASDCVDEGEVLPIEISRGCIFKCKYCCYPLIGKKKVDYLKSDNVLFDELVRNYEEHGVTSYNFCDDTYNDTMQKVEWIHNISKRLPFKLTFCCYARIDLIHANPDQIQILQESGLTSIFFGIESFNTQAAKSIGKGMPSEKVTDMLYRLREAWGNDVMVSAGIILGLPHDTYATMNKWLERILDFNFPVHNYSIYGLRMRKPEYRADGFISEFDANCEKYGYELHGTNDWTNSLYGTTFEECNSMAIEAMEYQFESGRAAGYNWVIPPLNSLGLTNKEILLGRKAVAKSPAIYNKIHQRYHRYLDRLMATQVA